jgi:hypothetical protein
MRDFFKYSSIALRFATRGVWLVLVASAPLLGAALGCSGQDSDTPAFDVAYVNASFPPQSKGYYITLGGDLYEYDYYGSHSRDDSPPSRKDRMSRDDIKQMHGDAKQIATVPIGDVSMHLGQLDSAWKDAVMMQRTGCADGGRRSYLGYYDEGGGSYIPALIAETGNPTGINVASGAKDIFAWLKQLTHTSDCGFTTGPCAEKSCSAEAPTCSDLTSDENLDATHCAEVTDCAACSSGACVIDASGTAHCTVVEDCSSKYAICAAGSSWCTGDPVHGIKCTQP